MAEFLQAFVKWWIDGPHRDVRARHRLFWIFGLVALVLILADPMMGPLLTTLDVGFLYSLDLGLLFEMSVLLYVLAVRDNGRAPLHAVRQIPAAARSMFGAARRGFGRARRTACNRLTLPASGDEDGPAWAFA